MPVQYTIGALAKAGGVGVETIRYYERVQLMIQPIRPYGTVRRYRDSDLERLRFIKRAKGAGFSLGQIGALIRFQHDQSCRETRELAATKLEEVQNRLAELRSLRAELKRWITLCDANNSAECCPALSAIAGQETST